MRQEDKEVDGPEIEQAEDRKRESELVEEKDDALYDLDGQPETTVDGKRAGDVIAAMKRILAGEQIVINDLALPKRQLTALEALKAAVDGKDTELSRFVYAEDRRTLLEQALAVLQPELSTIQGLGQPFEELLARVGTLRDKLNVLEDAEEELVEGRAKDAPKTEGDTDDKPDDDAEGNDGDDKPKPKKPKQPKQTDEDASLTGPERPETPKGPTTLGDPKDIEAAAAEAAVPRWRKSGG